jgi:RHS repeat-associated protein
VDYLGTPTHAYDSKGALVWERELDIYGAVRKETGESGFIPQLYQGQYEDEETGLCYNRFRYYDSESGYYISQDPIGLAGSIALYAYVHDTNGWVDVFGLAKTGDGFTIDANTAQTDVIARGVHFNVKGPGIPRNGGHLTLSPLRDLKGNLTGNFELKSDVATQNLTKKQMKQISGQVTEYLRSEGHMKKLSDTAKGALERGGISDPRRIKELNDASSVLDDHLKNGTTPKCL